MLTKLRPLARIKPFNCRLQIRKNSDNAPNSRNSGPVTFATLALMCFVGGGLIFYYDLEKEKKTKQVTASEVVNVGKPALGGEWTLVDQDGICRTDASFKGKYTLLYFGFTYCPDICPSELVKIGKISKVLASRPNSPQLTPLFISVDPNRDTVGQMKHYSKDFHKDMIYLTGTKDQVAIATKAYRVYFSKANENIDDDEDYLVDHSIVLYLHSPDGEFLDFFTQKMQVNDIVEKIMKHHNAIKEKSGK